MTYKSYVSMAKMRVLKPQLDEIKAKVGEDNQMLMQQEQMKLYKQVGVNPLGGFHLYSKCRSPLHSSTSFQIYSSCGDKASCL